MVLRDENGKGIKVGNRVAKRGSGSNVSHSSGAAKEKGESLKASTSKPKKEKGKKGKSHLLEFKVDRIPSKLGFYVANSFNADTMEIKLKDMKTYLEKINWCEYVWRCLKKFKEGWKPDMSNSFFLGLITCLAMLYVDGTVCNEFNVGQKRPPTSFWTMELLKEREYEEINARGIGKGELQGPFVEEDDPMPEDEDGFLWKLNTYVDNIRKERDGFERTFVEASNVLCGNKFIADVYQQYRVSLHYKNVGNEATQKEVFTMVDKVVEEFESSKKGNDFEAPSFSFRVTQDFDMVLSLETPVTDTNTPVLGSSKQLESINAVPVSMFKTILKDKDVVHGRGKRKYTKSQAGRSPFMSRVTDINATESKEEKRVKKFLLNKIKIDQSAILFETETGTKASRKQMKSLVNGENIDNAVMDAWYGYMNSLESLRGEIRCQDFSYQRLLCFTNYLMDVETVNERAERKNMINLVDLQKSFCAYLARLNPNKTAFVLRVEVTREDFDWKTDKRPNDSGVFWMRHMEHGIQVAEVPVKRMKLPTRGK
uniref:C2 calcium-dependent membrane targeting n=1 Tax=Tanacetum cinerariifolium TaxID=118510 RepID=A0A699HLA9_TANCI|nr:C2 calcium-dependent membrane targeting [Tanacetum cinerariifolium]